MTHESVATVLLIEDFEEWRYQQRKLLFAHPEWKIIYEACDGAEGVRKAAELQPDIILLDVGLPKLNGIEAARRIGQASPQVQIVFVTQDRDKDVKDAALSIKGTRYVLKANAASELVPAIASALAEHYTAIHADEDLRKDPYCRLGQAVHSWKVDVDFGWIFTPIR